MLVDGGEGGAITAERVGCQVTFEVTSTSACEEQVDIFNEGPHHFNIFKC